MPTQMIELCYRNILETSTVTVTSEDTPYPAYRLYDRDIGKFFKGNSTPSNFYITLNQGAAPIEVDRLLIPSGHNLNGLLVKLQYSIDDFSGDINDALSWTQSGSGLIDKPFTAQTKQYWRLNIASPASAPEMTEMFLTKSYVFERNPNYGLGDGDQKNIELLETQSGQARAIKWGEVRKYREYELRKLSATQKSALQTWDRHCEGIKNVYLEDHEGNVFFAQLLTKDLIFRMESEGRYAVNMEFREVP